MTPEEFERLRSYAEERMDNEYENTEWFHVADKLDSPDMKGLLAWFESPDCHFAHAPRFFLAVDRWSLEVADDQEPITDLWAECIVASEEGGAYGLSDDQNNTYACWSAGYGSDRMEFEDGIMVCMNLEQRNRAFMEMCPSTEYDYWKALQTWADETPRFQGFENPEGRAYWPSEEWDRA